MYILSKSVLMGEKRKRSITTLSSNRVLEPMEEDGIVNTRNLGDELASNNEQGPTKKPLTDQQMISSYGAINRERAAENIDGPAEEINGPAENGNRNASRNLPQTQEIDENNAIEFPVDMATLAPSDFERAKSLDTGIQSAFKITVDNMTEKCLDSLIKTLKGIKYILDDIIFEYDYEIQVVGNAIMINSMEGSAENQEIMTNTLRNMEEVKHKFGTINDKLKFMIDQMNDVDVTDAIKLSLLLMFLGNPFEKGNVALKLFVHKLFSEELIEIFTDKYRKQGMIPTLQEPSAVIDQDLRHSISELDRTVKVDELKLIQDDYERAEERNKQIVSDFILIEDTSELQQISYGKIAREEALNRLATRIYNKYTSPTSEDLKTIDGADIYQYATKYFTFLGQRISDLTDDGKNLLEEIVIRLREMKTPNNKLITAIQYTIGKITDEEQAALTLKRSRSPIQKIAITGYHIMKNILSKSVVNVANIFHDAYVQIKSTNGVNVNTYVSQYKIPRELEVMNPNLILIATEPKYRKDFLILVNKVLQTKMLSKDVKDAILMYIDERIKYGQTSASQDQAVRLEPFSKPINLLEDKQRLDKVIGNSLTKKSMDLLKRLHDKDNKNRPPKNNQDKEDNGSAQAAAAAAQDDEELFSGLGSLNGGKRKQRRKTVKKRKTKKNSKALKKSRRRNTKKN